MASPTIETDAGKWNFWIDRGGTFTDVVARTPDRRNPRPQGAVGEPRRL